MKRITLILSMFVLLVASVAYAAPPLAEIDPIPDQTFEGVGTYTYQATYTTYEPECLARATFSLVDGPEGMTITSNGYISWTGPGWGGVWDVEIKLFAMSDCLHIGSSTDYESFTLSCQNNC